MRIGTDIILVTGATGSQGGATARELLARGHKVRVMTRNPDGPAAKTLATSGAEVVPGDLDDAASLEHALEGAWGAYALQNTWEAGVEGEEEQGKRFAQLAAQAGIEHFVYASVASADQQTGIPHFDNKGRIEETVRSLDFPSFTIVRPVFFMENLVSPWFKPGIDDGQIQMGVAPETVVQMIAVADIGKYGRLAFEEHEKLNGRAIDIAGDELTIPKAASLISAAAGRTITHFQVPIEEVRKVSEDFAIMLEWFDRVGYSINIAMNAEEFDIPPTTFATWASSVSWERPRDPAMA